MKKKEVLKSLGVGVLGGYICQCILVLFFMFCGRFCSPNFSVSTENFIPNASIIIIFGFFVWWFCMLGFKAISNTLWCKIAIVGIVIAFAFVITTFVTSFTLGFKLWDSKIFWIFMIIATILESTPVFIYIKKELQELSIVD